MGHLMQDVRFGCRMLFRHPALSVISILTFGVGIGITTMVFSIVNGAFFKGLPFEAGDRIVGLVNTNPSRGQSNLPVSVQDYAVWEQRQTVFQSIGPWSVGPINLTWHNGTPERFAAGMMSPGAFDTLRVRPLLGRTFRPGDDRPGAEPFIILGYEIWRDRFGKSPDVLGRAIRAGGSKRTVVGVMPEGFAFPNRQQVWIPLEVNPLATKRGEGPGYAVVARLKDGASVGEAKAQAAAISGQLAREFPETNRELAATVRPFTETFLGPEIYSILYTMFAAGVGVLLIACVNVANLLLARTSLRIREVAVRMALGAGRGRIIAQFMVEVALLAAAGGAVGCGLAYAGMQWFLQAIAASPPPFFITFGLDHRVMGCVLAAVAGSSVFAGLIPAMKATGKHTGEALKDESRGSTGLRIGRFSSALVVAEVAVSCGLLIGAGLMIKSVVRLKTVRMPFATEHVFTARIHLPRAQYPDGAGCVRFYEQLLPRLAGIPGVEAATLSDGLPAAGNGIVPFQVEGQAYARDSDYPTAREGVVTPGYFGTFQTEVRRGREFTVFDRPDSPFVAVINESFAKAHFPGVDPLGRRFRLGRNKVKDPWRTIVGLVPDMMMQGVQDNGQSGSGYYIPIAQSEVTNFVSIALRTRGEPAEATPAVRAAVMSLDPDLAVYDVLSMREVIARATWFYRIFGTLFTAFGCVALLLAVAGLYGVMSFSVTQRTREMGIRVALGAGGSELVRLVMGRGVVRLSIGLALGLGLGSVASHFLQTLLYHVDAHDPGVLAAVAASLAVSGLLASFIPARRVTRIDPVQALASE